MGRGKSFAAVLGTAAFAMLLSAGSASATFHLTKVREISPGNGSDNSYVEVQMYAPFQNFLSNGAKIAVVQQHLLAGPGGVLPLLERRQRQQPGHGAVRRQPASPSGSKDFNVNLNLQDRPGRRRRLLRERARVQRLRFLGQLQRQFDAHDELRLERRSGTPAPALTSGMALRRSIAAGCPTALEAERRHQQQRGRLRCHDPQPAEELGRAHGDCLRPNRPDRIPGATEFPGHGEEEEVQEAQAEPGFRQRRHRARQRQHSGLRGQEEVQEEAEVATRRPAAACLAGR